MNSLLQQSVQLRHTVSSGRLLKTPVRNMCFSPCQAGARRPLNLPTHRVVHGTFKCKRWATQHSASARRGKAVTPHRVRSGSGSSNGTGSHNKDTMSLHDAAQQGRLETAESLLADGADVNAKDTEDDTWVSEGWTPLHYAAWVDDIDMAELLLSHGANVDAADDAGATPLAVTVCCKHKQLTELLLKQGANPSPVVRLEYHEKKLSDHPLGSYLEQINYASYDEIWTPLHHAALRDEEDVVRLLLAHGATPDDMSKSDRHVEFALSNGNLDLFKLLWSGKHDSEEACSHLYTAIFEIQPDIVEYLLGIGVDLTQIGQGQTLLHMAVSYAVPFVIGGCKEKALDFHRIYGAGEEVLGDDGDEPKDVYQAAKAGRLRIVQALLDHGVDANAAVPIPEHDEEDTDTPPEYTHQLGWTALHCAACNRQPEVIELLCKHGANVEARTAKGRTPLHNAAYHNEIEAVKMLLSYGADATARDNQGQTAVHSAASQDDRKQGAHDLEALNQNFKRRWPNNPSVLSHDREFTQFEPVILDYTQTTGALIAHSADVSAQDNQGLTPLHCATRDNNLEMIRTLLSCQVDIDARTLRGRTALQFAVHRRNKTVAETLVDMGADVNSQDNQGCTSLHACAHAESSGEHSAYTFYSEARVNSAAADFAAMLLNHGADPALKNQQGQTLADLAEAHGDSSIIQVLRNFLDKAHT